LQLTQVNLNNMLCPAVSDPFHGLYYRLFAITHQCLLIPSLGKIYAALARHIGWAPLDKEASVADLIMEELQAREEREGANSAIDNNSSVVGGVCESAEARGENAAVHKYGDSSDVGGQNSGEKSLNKAGSDANANMDASSKQHNGSSPHSSGTNSDLSPRRRVEKVAGGEVRVRQTNGNAARCHGDEVVVDGDAQHKYSSNNGHLKDL
jgi:hypothetical protein